MMTDHPATPLLEHWSRALASAIEATTGADCTAGWRPVNAAEIQQSRISWWRVSFEGGCGVQIGAERDRWTSFLQVGGGIAASEEAGGQSLPQLLADTAAGFAPALSAALGEDVGAGEVQDLTELCVSDAFAVWVERRDWTGRVEVVVEFDSTMVRRLGAGPAGSSSGAAERMPAPMADLHVALHARVTPTTMSLGQVLRLRPGSIVELGPTGPEPIEISVKGMVIARGRLSLSDGKVVVSVTATEYEKNEGRPV